MAMLEVDIPAGMDIAQPPTGIIGIPVFFSEEA